MSTTMQHTPYLSSYASTFSFAGGATRANVGGARAREHLSRALEEIDGLFAGMKYLDATEPLHTTARPNSVPDDDLALELGALCRAASSRQPPIPQSDQEIAWSSVRDVRDGMQCHWRHFVKVSQDLDMPIINKLRETYKDAKGLREAGVFAFRNTLTGPSPNNLGKIFAFCSLSYVVSCLLHARGRFEKTEILAGLNIWLNAIEIPQEREVFRILAQRLWPEARHLHSFDMGISPLAQEGMATLRRGGYPQHSITGIGPLSSSFAPSYTPAPSSSILDSSLQAPGLSAAAFVPYGFPPANTFTEEKVQDVCRVTEATRGEMQFYTLDPASSDLSSLMIPNSYDDTGSTHGQILDTSSSQPSDTGQGQLSDTDQGQHLNTSYSQDTDYSQLLGPNYNIFADASLDSMPVMSDFPQQPVTSSALDSRQTLLDTRIFAAVLEYYRENGNFWYDLSGWGAISKDIRLLLEWFQERAIEEQRICEQYLAQLVSEKDAKDVPSQGIVSVAEAFVRIGYLQSVDEVKSYMTAIAKSLFCDAVAHEEFVAWILPPEETPGYPCPTCARSFTRKWNMQRHCEDVHNQRVKTEGGQQRRGRARNVRSTVALEE